MAGGEFDLINHYFRPAPDALGAESVVLGIGDDAALLQSAAGHQLAVSVDTLVAGVHFPEQATPAEIARRALRVNLSDLAAMGATPAWFTLALTLPGDWSGEDRRDWVAAFSRALKDDARAYDCELVGGDTTSGPLSVTLQVMGQVPPGDALRRDGAEADDFVLVTGTLGDGAAGLEVVTGGGDAFSNEHRAYLADRFYRPEPQLAAGRWLAGRASSALDVSDGLLADLEHLCRASDLAAEIDVACLPLSDALASQDPERARQWALAGGDDYQLLFTLAPDKMPALAMAQAEGLFQATVIGRMATGAGVHCELDGAHYRPEHTGYRHFDQ